MTPGNIDELKVGDLKGYTRMPPTLQKSAELRQAVEALLANPYSRSAYVIDVEGNLVGALSLEGIMKLVMAQASSGEGKSRPWESVVDSTLGLGVERAMRKPRPVKASTPLKEALSIMLAEGLSALPVVDDDFKLIGELDGLALLKNHQT